MHNKIAQKLLSIGVSASLMLAMVPNNGAYAELSGFFEVDKYQPNLWGCSNLRAYLNNVEKVDGTLPLDSTTSGSNSANYPARFSDAEYALVQPVEYDTKSYPTSSGAKYHGMYTTTDKFWLPGGKKYYGSESDMKLVSLDREDASYWGEYDNKFLIPLPYWCRYAGNSNVEKEYGSFLRSPYCYYGFDSSVGVAYRDGNIGVVSPNKDGLVAAACIIDVSSVTFASAASAADIVGSGTEGAKKIEILRAREEANLPDYGMYLKTKSDSNFTPSNLTLSKESGATKLTVNYSGGVADQYVVVQAFNSADPLDEYKSYMAAQKLEDGQSSATIDVSNWNLEGSLRGYKIAVWMEDGSGSLASATMPEIFYVDYYDGLISKVPAAYAKRNLRAFAMKEDLQCSWGDLAQLSNEDRWNISKGEPTSRTNRITGVDPTNQKIYFGGMEFWIAGRTTSRNPESYHLNKNGDFMMLYQAKSDETQQFNASDSYYKEILNTVKTTVELPGFGSQRIMVRGSYDVLPEGTQLVAKVVPDSPDIDPQNYDIEHKFHYEIKLVDKNGNQLPMPLAKKVELLFEVVKGLDKDDLEVILAQVGEDLQFEENLVNVDGVDYVGVWTNHFSPYTLIDKLTDEEKVAMMKTGDEITYFTIATLGLIMTLALGLMINSRANKKKFD